jgi:hypothetical protein
MPGTERSTEPAALRFGVNLGRTRLADGSDGVRPSDAAHQAEAPGLDIVTAADHVGLDSPLIAPAAAAVVTSRVRPRSDVLDFGFWNLGLPATDVATLDVLSAGRLGVRIGLGHTPTDVLLQQVVIDADPERVDTEISAHADGVMTPAQLLDSPFALLAASAGDAATELLTRSRSWGITFWCTRAPSGAALTEVIKAVRS